MTRADVARLGRRQQKPTRQPGELLAVFVAGRLTNPLNERHDVPWFAGKHARYKRQWKERVAMALLEAGWRHDPSGSPFYGGTDGWYYAPVRPKRITFHAIVPTALDSTEGLRAAMKPLPDALKACGVIDDDRDSAGHVFLYSQEARRKAGTVYGVELRVALLPAEPLER